MEVQKQGLFRRFVILLACMALCLSGCSELLAEYEQAQNQEGTIVSIEKEQEALFGNWSDAQNKTEEGLARVSIKGEVIAPKEIPEFSGNPYFIINGNQPNFTEEDFEKGSFETYSELDKLGRCGVAYANIGTEIMPTEERGAIGHVKPTGWHTVKYDCVNGKYLYNRCHLIGYQLAGENANTKNLITGTRYLNIDGMLSLENMVADYVKTTSNHVLYRITPIYKEDDLLCLGLQMEACSVEDRGGAISYNVFAYNSQPGIVIDYATGESWLE